MGNNLSLIASIAVPLVGGTAIGISMRDDVKSWYPTIKKPSWNPPNWIFGPVWSLLYTAMGVASWRVLQAGGGPLPLGLYAGQLALNFIWSPLFFKYHNLKAASYEITALLGVVGATIYEFGKVDPLAGRLMLPYLGWTAFATALTWNIHLNNPEDDQGRKSGRKSRTNLIDSLHGVASEATAAAATPFLANSGETQTDALPDDVSDDKKNP